jgi:hypothetical protein
MSPTVTTTETVATTQTSPVSVTVPSPITTHQQALLNAINTFVNIGLQIGLAFIRNPNSQSAQHITQISNALAPAIPLIELAGVSAVNAAQNKGA